MPISNISAELVRQVSSCLDPKDLTRTNLVCRTWLVHSNELNWAQHHVYLDYAWTYIGDFVTLLGSNSNIPRNLSGLWLGEPSGLDEEEMTRWRDNLYNVLIYFNRIKHMSITRLDTTKFPPEQRKRMFNSISITIYLQILTLKVAVICWEPDMVSRIAEIVEAAAMSLESLAIGMEVEDTATAIWHWNN